ncbi:hypothetical protein VKI21_06780 [Cyanobacterium aponinum UTEX 3222]|uniref:Uncharacterized protein n=1 Tax=Cyanobacterium aponinum (strain PCC 10605) TaxID=755178 RepID=K9Z8M8_CYAAP|nr:hypothetical protein [Cyanobacterium aponinum]AFZ55519.1 hypothetical protein Cyan10605_3484 [Cyanobacterium aponinum PCC 10605]WRL37046.1 hypothetical protein VKI22_10430 [Cyanobacterium aponinum UTEX 3221]WRL43381.1 hypothetical protein VKI21_06780 [Cyanobacterium aponinum UTEX 3222]
MNQTIEVNIADILVRLEGKIDKLENKIDHLTNEVNEVKINVAKLDEKLNSVESNFKTNFEGLDKRLVNLEFVYRGAGVAIIGGILLAIFRFLFPDFTI